MKTLYPTLIGFASIGVSSGMVLVTENFDSLAAGENLGSTWNAKWDGGDTTQQNLVQGDGSGAVNFDLSTAKRQYYVVHQTGVQVGGAGGNASITVAMDIVYTHAGGGNPTNLNQAFFGPNVSTTDRWWSGTNVGVSFAQRGGAIGNNLGVAPWIEGWQAHNSLGIADTAVGGTSVPINISYTMTDNGTTIDAFATFSHAGGSYNTMTVDTGLASGTTLYPGFSTHWNGSADPIGTVTNISNINIDNFSVSAVPEPSTALLSGLAAFGLLRRRR